VLQDENVHTAIMRIQSFEDLKLYQSIMYDIEMTPEENNDIAKYRQTAGLFCHGCEQCKQDCPHGLPIPDIMRAYMYAYGYGTTQDAYDVISSLSLDEDSCNKCPVCSVNCSNRFDIAGKIKDILRIKQVPAEFLS
jgi:predicted aldo/keto reductase-like oxidoreductase